MRSSSHAITNTADMNKAWDAATTQEVNTAILLTMDYDRIPEYSDLGCNLCTYRYFDHLSQIGIHRERKLIFFQYGIIFPQ